MAMQGNRTGLNSILREFVSLSIDSINWLMSDENKNINHDDDNNDDDDDSE